MNMSEKKFIKIQKQMKDNDEDLQMFLRDMDNWESDMKNRDKELRKSSEKNKSINSKECEKRRDEESDDEHLLIIRRRQQANEEKARGNNFFKKEKWTSAIECYTQGINLDPQNAVLLANRAMALLKNKQFGAAESDCTSSLSLDPTYVKSYLRRAAARIELGKIEEATRDLRKTLEIEPDNKQAKEQLKIIKQLNIEENKTGDSVDIKAKNQDDVVAVKKTSENKPNFTQVDPELLVTPVTKPPHLRLKVPLTKVNIASKVGEHLPLDAPWNPALESNTRRSIKSQTFQKIEQVKTVFDQALPVTHKEVNKPQVQDENTSLQSDTDHDATSKLHTHIPPCPECFVQFHTVWRRLKGKQMYRFEYLKKIPTEGYRSLFGDLLESDVFSEILEVLATNPCTEAVTVLLALTKVPRFHMLQLFLSKPDKAAVEKILNEHVMKIMGEDNLIYIRQAYRLSSWQE